MKQLLLDFLWSHLQSLGAFRSPRTTPAAREAAGVLPVYDSWFAECVRVLAVEGYLRCQDAEITAVDRPVRPLAELWRDWESVKPRWRANPDLAATHVLVETMLRALPEILTGERLATEVMFPGSSMELVETAYKTNPASEFFNRVLATELVTHLRSSAGSPPRILEIGAGTGATSAVVLRALQAEGLAVREYCYTDLSRAFLEHAERSYGPGNPFLAYHILNVENPLTEQGIPVGEYDVVIAANVLHATKNIRTTLRNTKAALRPGGLLLLNELTVNNLLNQFTFGLLEGWWRFEDPEWRIPGSPILSADHWQRVLAEEGFGPVTFPAREAADLGQQIIVAESDGVVQRSWPKPEPLTQSTPTGPAAHIEDTVLDVLAGSLRIDRSRIVRTEPFAGYGLDSIFAVQVARAVGEKLDIDLDITVLFEYTTLADLVEFIAREFSTVEPSSEVGDSQPVEQAVPDGIAIIGMSARFPQADDIDEFWRIVEQGTRCITNPPADRLDWAPHAAADTTGTWAGFLDGVHEFDPLFFGMSVTEARQVSPELRLVLMAAWNAIEDAGYQPADLRVRPTGVFIAAGPSEYQPVADDGPSLTGLPSPAMIPNRISYLLDLPGPSEQCDTTCSSSLVALHRAIRSIRDGECDQALVGAVNLVASPAGFAGMRTAGMLSPTGDVRPFQQDSDGIARGEGVGAVLIKPLRRAVEDGDFVYGIVRGTGVAHGGKGVSFTAPNIRGMKSAITRAYADADVDPATVAYVETHSMSSVLADSAEVSALGATLRGPDPVYLGSMKPTIGHTEVFSGLAALVKAVQAIRRGTIPAIPGFGRPHPDIPFGGTPLRPATETIGWPVRTGEDGRPLPRRASVNSFGISGVNAHVVLEQHVTGEPGRSEPSPQVLVLSGKTEDALRERARRLVSWLKNVGTGAWADVAYTLQVGREPMEHRVALVAADSDEAVEILDGWLNDDPHARARVASARDDHQTEVRSVRPEVLAERWVAGGPVDWALLHEGTPRRRVPLPGYPFAHRTCFSARTPVPPSSATGPRDFVTELMASVLGLEPREIDSTRSLADYGLNSLLLIGVLGRVRAAFPGFQPDWLQVDNTVDDIAARLSTVEANTAVGSRFPELLHLNGISDGRPVFWIHGALASVESFRTIAARINRPFYGIQARGFMTEDTPVVGVSRMAEYYIDALRSVQPEGPYDLGGFCLGGIVAYEMTRQLQLRGHAVTTLTMVDSPDNTGLAASNASGVSSEQSAALQVVNSLLWPAGEQDLTKVRPWLIHRDEVAGCPDAEFVPRLADLAVRRGMAMRRDQVIGFIERNIRVQLAYRIDEYRIQPLPDPEAVGSTYFHNRRGLFMGELAPYFQVVGETFSLDGINYRQDWARELTDLRVVDIDVANHMTVLNEDASLAVIERVCVETYAE
ncbi:beta-ketoacyl synthase N-terminal-like domain-containing protein [Actinokineospora inagensis]|uniref:beta-ketoacyl synthase N-terminal-like domain-containing protein n=1 Tax=Actinokineospora inagensis TaxID=103730 RepID=UPI0003FF5E14|nr:beta-ketoacyl synthase N-terminal-like domain-containing protein [Actinokineospora inagensis]